ncbi:MAG TPA: ATP-binding protein [Kofleriaceae bacterium]|jgi:two-component system OmpR family sensor kinase
MTLQARIALWFSAVIAIVLTAYTVAVYELAVDEPDEVEDAHAACSLDAQRAERELAQQRLLEVLGVALVASIAVAVSGAIWLTRRSLAPLAEVVGVCRTLELRDLSKRIEVPASAPPEVRELTTALNNTLGRLARSVEGLRRFTADASHELRTPLARIQSRLELSLRDERGADVAGALEELSDLVTMVEVLLTLAHADAGELATNARPVDVVALAREVVSSYEAVAVERGVSIAFTAIGHAHVKADEMGLKRVVTNLVDNACKFTPRGGAVHVSVARSEARVLVVLTDTGPGVAPADQPRLFERFYRGERTRALPGVGLGLALSREVARAYGGDVRLAPSTEGATFIMDLPACDG